MTPQDKRHKRKAIVGTVGVHLLLLLCFYFLKLEYTEAIEKRGIAINFGYVDADATDATTTSSNEAVPVEQAQAKPNITIEQDLPDATVDEPVVTQDVVDVVSVADNRETQVESESQSTEETVVEVEEVVEDPKPSDELTSALNELFFEGADNTPVDADNPQRAQGGPGGVEGGASTEKNTGSGINEDGYDLANRKALVKGTVGYDCEATGLVVVRVWVNAEGITYKAQPGYKGTTEQSPCLWKEAEKAALQTTWTPDPSARATQIGKITYNFYKK